MDIRAAKRIVLAKWPKAHIERFGWPSLNNGEGEDLMLQHPFCSDIDSLWIQTAKGMDTRVI